MGKLIPSSKRFDINKGPDRMELMSNFALRNPVKFELANNTTIEVVINGISVESADCHSWLLIGYTKTTGEKFEGYYKTHPKYQGEFVRVLGFLDITPSPTGKSEIG